MANELTNKYFVKRNLADSWVDVTTKFDGLKVLTLDGFNERGDAVNVFTQQWVDSQKEDVMVTTQNNLQQDVIIRQNVDLSMTIIVSRRYATSTIDEETVYNSLCAYLDGGKFYIKSAYTNEYAEVICIKGFKPTVQKLQRGNKSYIMATIPLHCIDKPTVVTQ